MLKTLKRRIKSRLESREKRAHCKKHAGGEIRVDDFEHAPDVPHVDSESPLSSGPLRSEIARMGRLESDGFGEVLTKLQHEIRAHRKLWELCYVVRALEERNKLTKGMRGLAFAVGREPLPAYFTGRDCEILATDLDGSDDRSKVWNDTAQWSGTVDNLIFPHLCSAEKSRELMSYRPVDMNNIPNDLTDFDFTWSTCSFEHCGSIELGLNFLRNQMKCLKPGGVAVHTTEFNLSSQKYTLEDPSTVIFRLKDIEAVVRDLRADGHHVEPLDIRLGDHPLDRYVDTMSQETKLYSEDKHMRLNLADFASTSIGLIITKDGDQAGQNTKDKGQRN